MSTDETIITSIEGLKEAEVKHPYLTFIAGPRLGELVRIEKEVCVVGRSPDCDLWIEDGAISRRHFRIKFRKNKVTVEDLGSTNGTYVNGEKIGAESELKDGDKIQISRGTIFELNYLDATRSLSEQKRYEMGVMDPVTNIYNKRFFLDRIREEFSFAKRKNGTLAVIMLDIDHFKQLNDRYGHLAGDAVLQKVCAEISKTVRTGDVFARYGGEEFAVIMRDTEKEAALHLAERMRRVIADMTVEHKGEKVRLTISCGVAVMEEGFKDYMELIARADEFLYQSKKGGRNRVTG